MISEWIQKYVKSVNGAENWTDLKCAKHTKKKYQGVLKLKDFGLKVDGGSIEPNNNRVNQRSLFEFDGVTCSFCKKYYDSEKPFKTACKKCPIHKEHKNCNQPNSAFSKFIIENNPEKMIELMDKIIAKCNEKGEYVK